MADDLKSVSKLILKEEDIMKPETLRTVMEVISSNPRLAGRYVDALQKLEKDNEYYFTTIEKDMFISMKVLFDEVYERSINQSPPVFILADFLALAKLTSQMYECLQNALSKAKAKERPTPIIDGLKKMTIETDDQVATLEVKDKEGEVVDIDAEPD